VLGDGADGRHHGHAPVLELSGAEVAEAGLVALLREAQRVEEADGARHADLLGRQEHGRFRRFRGRGPAHDERATLPHGRETQLLHAVLPRRKVRGDDAERREHGHAPVVDLLVPHVLGVLPEPGRVAEVPGLLRGVLPPQAQLHGTRDQEERREAVRPRRRGHGGQARRHAVEARELHVVLGDGADGRHHGHAPVLELSGAEVAEAGLVALLREAQRVEEPDGARHANLLGRQEHGLCLVLDRRRPGSGSRGLLSGCSQATQGSKSGDA